MVVCPGESRIGGCRASLSPARAIYFRGSMIPACLSSSSALTFVPCSSSSTYLLPAEKKRSVYYHHRYHQYRRRKPVSRCCATDNEPNTRLRARVAYVGTRYHGWQLQQNSVTIQGQLESVLRKRFRRLIRVVGASRTDTGVHSRGQGVHFDIPLSSTTFSSDEDVGQLQHSMNRMLPNDIRVSCMEVAPLSEKNRGYRWHAMYNSTGKYYAYRLCTRKITTVRTIRDITLSEESTGHLRLDFRIDGALYRMIRNVVGTLLAVAHGSMKSENIPVIFASKDREMAPMGAPACGLCLEHVYYDGWNQSAASPNQALV